MIEEPEPKPNMQKPSLKKLGPLDVATTAGVVSAGAVARPTTSTTTPRATTASESATPR